MNDEHYGWGIKNGKKLEVWSMKDTKEEAEKCLSQWATHTARLSKSVKVVKVKFMEV